MQIVQKFKSMSIILNEDTKAIYLKIKFKYITFLLITKFKVVFILKAI